MKTTMMSEFYDSSIVKQRLVVYDLTPLSSSDDDSDDEDDTAALMAELAKIKQERAEEKARLVRSIPITLLCLARN